MSEDAFIKWLDRLDSDTERLIRIVDNHSAHKEKYELSSEHNVLKLSAIVRELWRSNEFYCCDKPIYQDDDRPWQKFEGTLLPESARQVRDKVLGMIK